MYSLQELSPWYQGDLLTCMGNWDIRSVSRIPVHSGDVAHSQTSIKWTLLMKVRQQYMSGFRDSHRKLFKVMKMYQNLILRMWLKFSFISKMWNNLHIYY